MEAEALDLDPPVGGGSLDGVLYLMTRGATMSEAREMLTLITQTADTTREISRRVDSLETTSAAMLARLEGVASLLARLHDEQGSAADGAAVGRAERAELRAQAREHERRITECEARDREHAGAISGVQVRLAAIAAAAGAMAGAGGDWLARLLGGG